MTHARGHVILREFDRTKGTVSLRTLNIALTAMAGDNTYRFRDVGNDHVKITKDGPVLSIVGQIPFDFIGVLKIDLTTGEAIHEPSHDISGRLAEACARAHRVRGVEARGAWTPLASGLRARRDELPRSGALPPGVARRTP